MFFKKVFNSIYFNISLRGLGIILKFVLILLISREISISEFGKYNIISSSIAFFSLLIGLEFKMFSSREYVSMDDSILSMRFKNQLFFHLATYIVLLPILYPLWLYLLPQEYIYIFILLLISEHLTIEFHQVFISKGLVNFFNVLYFIKSGFWILILLCLLYLSFPISVFLVLLLWMIFNFISLSLSVFLLVKRDLFCVNFRKTITFDKTWLLKGLKVSIPFLLITLSSSFIEYFDRFVIEKYLDFTSLGVYSFCLGISTVIVSLMNSTVIAEYYHQFIDVVSNNNKIELLQKIKSLSLKVMIIYICFCIGVYFFLPIVIKIVSKPELNEGYTIVWFMILNSFIYLASLIFHMVIYSFRKDYFLMMVTFLGAILNLFLNLYFISEYGVLAAILSTSSVYLMFFISKVVYSYRLILKM